MFEINRAGMNKSQSPGTSKNMTRTSEKELGNVHHLQQRHMKRDKRGGKKGRGLLGL